MPANVLAEGFGASREIVRLLERTLQFEDRFRRSLADPNIDLGPVGDLDDEPDGFDEPDAPPLSESDYPRNLRRGDHIAKIGLKRDKGGTYEQRFDRGEYDRIGDLLVDLAGSFEAQDVMDRVHAPPPTSSTSCSACSRRTTCSTPPAAATTPSHPPDAGDAG